MVDGGGFDAVRGDAFAAVEEGGVGRGEFEQADLAGAQREGGNLRQAVGDAEAMGDRGDAGRAAGLSASGARWPY